MDEKELKSAQENLQKHNEKKVAESDRVYDLLTAASRISHRTVTHEIAGFRFETYSVIPADIKEEYLTTMVSLREGDSTSKPIDVCCKLMASICADKSLRSVDVWHRFEEQSGALLGLTLHIFKELSINMEDIKTFRKK